jgi:superfamily II DNA or RNA helicase
LLISATGTGKTYASAFAVKDFSPRRLLFIVHREQIAKQSLNSLCYCGSGKKYKNCCLKKEE